MRNIIPLIMEKYFISKAIFKELNYDSARTNRQS